VSHDYPVLASRAQFRGRVISIRSDDVAMPGGNTSTRDVVVHPGAVAVVAIDGERNVVLVRQYRHPVKDRLWELPAGLLDVTGEDPADAAARELHEETGLRADRWDVLVDMLTSPGMTDEAVRIYLARELTDVGRPIGEDEESDMTVDRIALDEAVGLIFAGSFRNGVACAGILAAAHAAQRDFAGLRPASSEWRDRVGR
jgi:8-oxo-dGDP phosphatase